MIDPEVESKQTVGVHGYPFVLPLAEGQAERLDPGVRTWPPGIMASSRGPCWSKQRAGEKKKERKAVRPVSPALPRTLQHTPLHLNWKPLKLSPLQGNLLRSGLGVHTNQWISRHLKG